MSDSTSPTPPSYSPELVRRVLERASEIEATQASWLTEDELRQVAAEVGLSPRALDIALAELKAPILAPSPSVDPHPRQLLKIGVIGAAASLAVTLFSADSGVAFLTLGACSLVLALAQRETNRLKGFVTSNAALWGGFLVGPAFLFNVPSLVLPVLTLAVTTVLGIGALRARESFTNTPKGGGPPAPGGTRLGRIVRALWRKLDRLKDSVEFRTLSRRITGRESVA